MESEPSSAEAWIYPSPSISPGGRLKPTTCGGATITPTSPIRISLGLRRVSFEGVRLRTGLVFSWGGAPEVTPAASCSVQPTEVMVGEPITATVTASNFNPKHTVTYAWSGNGGQVTGQGDTAQIDTNNAAPGSYTVTAHVTDAKAEEGKEANCSANYTIKPLPPKNPPTMSCSASPSSVQAGASVTVTCSCTSPDGVPVSVSNWTASSGNVSGSGNTATLNTAGSSPGTITVSATCTDSRGLHGSGFDTNDGGESSATTAEGCQTEPVRLPQREEAVARRQHLQSHLWMTLPRTCSRTRTASW